MRRQRRRPSGWWQLKSDPKDGGGLQALCRLGLLVRTSEAVDELTI
jgi:hypothetical protein